MSRDAAFERACAEHSSSPEQLALVREALARDQRRFLGQQAAMRTLKQGRNRNARCPCGSGRKVKRCCGG